MQSRTLSTFAKVPLFFLVPFLMGTCVDLYVPSLPAIVSYFHSEQHLVQLTIGLYMLGYGVGQLFLGILSDTTGRKKILVLSALLFTVISFISVFSPNVYSLIVCRFTQGLGMAGMGVMCRIIAVDCYKDQELVKTYTYYTASWAIGPVIGPVIGAYLQHLFGWKADFYYFGIFGFVILLAATFFLGETIGKKQTLQVKTIAFSIKELLSHSGFVLGSIVTTLIYSNLVIFNVIGPFIIQDTLHFTVVDYGHVALFLGFGCLVGTLLSRVLISYFKPMRIYEFGNIAAIIAAVISLIIAYIFRMNIYITVIPVFAFLFLSGLILSNIVAKAMSFFPHKAGTAGSVYGFISATGIFVMTALVTLLNTDSQKPILYFYTVIFIVALTLFRILKKKHQFNK